MNNWPSLNNLNEGFLTIFSTFFIIPLMNNLLALIGLRIISLDDFI